MPSPAEIVRLLHVQANGLAWLAIAWHAVILVGVIAVTAGWRPSSRTGIFLLVTPALSVSAAAFAYVNPFNGISFGLLAVVLMISGATQRSRPFEAGPGWAIVLGVALVLYGWCYPAFIGVPWYRTLYAAPAGVVPCPTLAVASGVALVAGGFGSRAIPAVLTPWTVFYAVFGIFRLGVVLDAGLLVASVGLVALLVHNVRGHAHQASSESASRTVTASG